MASLAHSPRNNTCYQVIHVAQFMEPIASCLAYSMHAWSSFFQIHHATFLIKQRKMTEKIDSGDDVSYGEQ